MKDSIDSLAIFGGRPAFADKLHVGRPNIGDRAVLMQRIEAILENRWLSNSGPFEQELERRIAEFVGVNHCIAMCNATVALEITIRALGMTGEVIVPSLTFVATAHALEWQQITPVFCDIDPETHNIDPIQIESLVTTRTTGIIGVHLWGRPCDTAGIGEVAARHDLRVLYDAAHAFGCTHEGEMVGRFGDAEVFSFHATKFMNSFEGGAVVTNDDELARKVRLMKNFGFTNWDEVSFVGTNGKMTEVAAAMGLTSLDAIDAFVATNRRNYVHYRSALDGIPGLSLIAYDEEERNNFQYLVVEVDEAATGLSRDALVQILWAENVVARRYFYPGCHRMEPYSSYYPDAGNILPQTEKVAARLLILPTGTAVDTDDIKAICSVLRLATRESGDVRRRLEAAGVSDAPRGRVPQIPPSSARAAF
jgi:dTDP-4-amino-4,6-dideoxygalactose transaminase